MRVGRSAHGIGSQWPMVGMILITGRGQRPFQLCQVVPRLLFRAAYRPEQTQSAPADRRRLRLLTVDTREPARHLVRQTGEAIRISTMWLAAPRAAPDFRFAQFTGGAGRWPSYGVIADGWPQLRQADGSRTCARSRFRAGTLVVFIRWQRWRRRAPRRISFCSIHRRCWPLAELRGRWRQLAAAAAS